MAQPVKKWGGTSLRKVPTRGSKLAREFPFVAVRDGAVLGTRSHTTALRDAVRLARNYGIAYVVQTNRRGDRFIAACEVTDDKRRVVQCRGEKPAKRAR